MGGPSEIQVIRPLRVLLVDDDPIVGAILARLLRPWSVLFVQSAVGALARIQAGGAFDAVLCDLSMPGMNGMEFHRAVAEVAPAMARRIVFVTGGAVTPEATAFLQCTANTVLMKPVDREAVRRAVTAVTAASGVAG